MSERARIGFIGLGVMGSRMAATLARAGHSLVVHVHQLYNACAAMGEGSSDFGAIIKVFEAWARIEVKAT